MRKTLVLFEAAVVIGMFAACGSAAESPPDIDGDAGTPGPQVPAGCVEDADTTSPEAAACMDDDFALFVDGAAGNDSNSGARAKPFKSIHQALEVADSRKRRVYICGTSTFDEHVKITTRVSLFGGFACDDWTYDGKKARISPSDAGFALHIDAVGADVTISDLEFVTAEGTAAGPSSIAVFVANSPSVVFRRLKIEAGAGANGQDGATGITGAPVSGDLDGNSGGDMFGGEAKVCTCSTGGSTTGGAGGDLNGFDSNGAPGLPTITPAVPETATGAGQSGEECNNVSGAARIGSQGPAGTPAPKANKVGTLDSTGWQPQGGADGKNGKPGQGGGGAGSRSNLGMANNGSGGSGGCGGCGGAGGGGGGAGGSSVALMTLASPVRLIGSHLRATTAGNGGAGGEGGSGARGGIPGAGFKGGCYGNSGGAGGKGGAGAGGPGGVSAAVLHKGDQPQADASSYEHGSRGTGGPGGVTAPDNNDGPDGLEGDVVPSP